MYVISYSDTLWYHYVEIKKAVTEDNNDRKLYRQYTRHNMEYARQD